MTKLSELVVQAVAKPAPKIKILKDNKELMIKDRFKIETHDVDEITKTYKFLIEDVQQNDAGKYKIELSNKCGSESSQTTFDVQGSNHFNNSKEVLSDDFECSLKILGVPVFVRAPVDLNIYEKKPAKIECEVIGIPVPVVEWYKDGQPIEKSDKIQIDVRNKVLNTLMIKSVEPENAGKYTIKAKNSIGEAEVSITLNVDGD